MYSKNQLTATLNGYKEKANPTKTVRSRNQEPASATILIADDSSSHSSNKSSKVLCNKDKESLFPAIRQPTLYYSPGGYNRYKGNDKGKGFLKCAICKFDYKQPLQVGKMTY